MRKAFWIAVSVLVLAGTPVSSAWAEQITVRAAPHKDYGRIVFKWPEPVPFDAKITGSRLIVTFGAPIEASYRSVTRSLQKYVGSAVPGRDGRSVVFALKGDFGVRSFYSGSAIVVDVVDRAPAKAAAQKQQADSPVKSLADSGAADSGAAASGPSIRVRSGVHETYTRLVFDWPRKVAYSYVRQGGVSSLTFEQEADIQLGRLATRPPKHVLGVSATPEDKTVTVAVTTSPTSQVRHFYAGTKVVVDVMVPGTRKADPAEVASANEAGKPAPPVKATPTTVPKTSQKTSQKTPEKTPENTAAPQGPKPIPLIPDRPAPGASQTEAKKTPDGETSKKASAAVTVQATPAQDTGKGVQLRFNWDEPVAAAVFRRAGYLWAIFDKPSPIEVGALRAAGGNVLKSIEQVPTKGATVLRMETIAGINPGLKRDGLAWILDFRKQPLAPQASIEMKPQPNSPVGARLFVPVPEPGEAIAVSDPLVGDNLVVVPVIPLGHGVLQNHRYAQVRILASAQGVVIQPLIDDLRVRTLRQGVEMTSQSRFDISPVEASVAAAAEEKGGVIRELTRAMDLKRWRDSTIETLRADRQKLQLAVASAKGQSLKEEARLNLARLFLSHGFAAETLAVLRRMREDRPAVKTESEYNLMEGVANYLMHRPEAAKAAFTHESLADNDEGKFWRAVLAEEAGGDAVGASSGASGDLKRLGAIVRPYPNRLKLPLSLMIAVNAVKTGDPKTARRYLNLVQAEKGISPFRQAGLDYAYGKFYELAGGFDPAVKKWEAAMKGPNRLVRAEAAVARAELLLKTKKMDRQEAIAELEKLRFAWRGDEFEFNLLRRLGGLYMDVGDYRNGLRTLKQAATHFRDHPKAPEITQEMADAFNMLFLENGADKLPPVTAIAIYEEFKELTPVGVKGDEMIRNLADRLVAVDLLARGAALLENQIKFRLKGADRARIGARLALVHIMDQKYESALDILDRTHMDGIPESLVNQRRYLRARAFIGLNRKEQALVLLKDDETISANLLRLDLFWTERDWPSATQVLQQIVKQYGAEPGQPLEDKQAKTLLDLAVAMTLAGNDRGIERLRRSFGKAMAATPFSDAFDLIASTGTQGLLDYRMISSKVKDVENFQAFMAAYRERLKKDKLSSLN